MLKTVPTRILVLVFAIIADAAGAQDATSTSALRDALVALGPKVDPREAELVSKVAHTTSRHLAREYRVAGPPGIHNFLIYAGLRKRGFCFDWARDIGARLKELKPRTLALHWGAAFAGTRGESNCLVVTARGQRFADGIVIDGWRKGGRLWWGPVNKDPKYVWKEDLAETALLRDYGPSRRKAIRTVAR